MNPNSNYSKPNSDNVPDAHPGDSANSASPSGDSWGFGAQSGGLIPSPAGGQPAGNSPQESESGMANGSSPK